MDNPISRRHFAAAVAAAPGILGAQASGSKVRVGWVGLGNRGGKHIRTLLKVSKDDATVKAICDTFAPRLAKTKDDVISDQGSAPETYSDYYKMLADPGIDAVFIMTPEHLHRDMAIAALEAGKHVYCEKPLSHTIEEGFEILEAVEASKKLFQVGTQRRSSRLYAKAREIYQSGALGTTVYARAFWYRNSPLTRPAWRYDIPADSEPGNTDYGKFLGPAPATSFNKQRYFQWRLYWDYSGGISTDLLVHQTDAIHMITGRQFCESVMCNGGIHYWTQDDREVPDTVTAGFEYDGHFHINYSAAFSTAHYGYGEQLCGSEGTMEIMNMRYLNVYPETARGLPEAVTSRPEMHFDAREDFNESNSTNDHIKNFIDAIAHGAELNCPAQLGHEAAVTGHLATLSLRKNKKVYWNQAKGTYHFG
ncbi:MAG: Gfo/Idh/MocA family oxidoreductase [Bryobacterales bacterium]|nr:Gfo/Idh/MocA family oxidoreductase [Bryobacterales bacterium]